MKIKLFQVDAFTDKVFSGNPAAVCPLVSWLDDSVLQNIAAENNLAETAFFVKTPKGYHIRWFTPKAEVDLCGHATLATGYVIFNYADYKGNSIAFQSRSGILTVTRDEDWLTLNFPADKFEKAAITLAHSTCFEKAPLEVYRGSSDLMFIYADATDIETAKPNLLKIAELNVRGIIITAKGRDTDFVSRFFGPAVGINEDPVTGSAHTTLTPYWSKQLGKEEVTARQISERGGYLKCRLVNDRVEISGQAAFYLEGEITI